MKTTKTAPVWAVELTTQVCKDYKRVLPLKLQWYKTSRKHTSGYTSYYGPKIHISAGRDDWEHRVVLLHELAHHIRAKSRKGKNAGHNNRFWSLFWELSQTYGDLQLSYKRDVEMATAWRPGTRVKAGLAFDRLPKK